LPDFLSAVVIVQDVHGSVTRSLLGTKKALQRSPNGNLSMFSDTKFRAAALIRPGMEVITSDGKRAGYVVSVNTGEIITRSPERRIALEWVRRVEDDVYLGLRAQQLMWE
jgi:hypothetical protein